MKSKMIAAALAAVLLISGCGADEKRILPDSALMPEQKMQNSAAEPQAIKEAGADASFLYGRSFLEQSEQELYDRLLALAGQYDFETEITVPVGAGDHDLARLCRYFSYDNPRYYWAEPKVFNNAQTGRRTLRLTPASGMTASRAREQQTKIEDAAAGFLEDIDGDAFSVVSAVHDKIVREVARGDGTDENTGNLYGALVEKKAICDGYAKLFQYLMQQKGIDCIYYQGESIQGTPHAWNAVYIEDGWYYVDVTWDTLNPGRILHTHLGLTLDETLRERVFDAGQYPEIVNADSTEYNYFKRNGYYVSPDDTSDIIRELAQAFVKELGDREHPSYERLQFLELKVYASPEVYREVKQIFVQNPFLILREMDEIARKQGLDFRVMTQGNININHKDTMQILILWPGVTGFEYISE